MDWFMTKIRIGLWWYEFKTSIKRTIYCKRKYHTLTVQSKKVTFYANGKESTLIDVDFISCKHCGYKFFATMKDRITFEKYEANERKVMQHAFKAMLSSRPVEEVKNDTKNNKKGKRRRK